MLKGGFIEDLGARAQRLGGRAEAALALRVRDIDQGATRDVPVRHPADFKFRDRFDPASSAAHPGG